MKLITLTLSLLMFTFSCSRNPQDHAQEEADKNANIAQNQADNAEASAEASDSQAASAMGHAVLANANELMAQVKVPTLSNGVANESVKKVGNYIIEYVNANDNREANNYEEKVKKELAHVNDLVSKGRISSADATQITTYAQNLCSAVGIPFE